MTHLLCFVGGIAVGLMIAIIIMFEDLGGDEN